MKIWLRLTRHGKPARKLRSRPVLFVIDDDAGVALAPPRPDRAAESACDAGVVRARRHKEAARACLAPAMEAFYQRPFERFERYCPTEPPTTWLSSSPPTPWRVAGSSPIGGCRHLEPSAVHGCRSRAGRQRNPAYSAGEGARGRPAIGGTARSAHLGLGRVVSDRSGRCSEHVSSQDREGSHDDDHDR